MAVDKLTGDLNRRVESQINFWPSRVVPVPFDKKITPRQDSSPHPDFEAEIKPENDQFREKETVILKPITPEQKEPSLINNYPLNIYTKISQSSTGNSLINLLA